jgi:hypothetical protein
MVRWIYVITSMLLIACGERASLRPKAPFKTYPPLSPTALSPSMLNYLNKTFPQWKVVEKSDYSKTWWSFYDSSYNPCWARTDINDDWQTDYALWLKKETQLRLVICTGKADGSYNYTIVIDSNKVFNEKEHNLSMGIAVAPPAQIDVVKPRIQSLVLKSNGFALMELEERTRIWYQENERIQTFYMK